MAEVPTLTVPTVESKPVDVVPYVPNRFLLSGAFGTKGDGLLSASAGLARAGNDLASIADEQTTRNAKNADVQYMAAQRQLLSGDGTADNPGYLSLQGENAVNGRAALNDGLAKARASIVAGLGDDQRAITMFNQAASVRDQSFLSTVDTHYNNQSRVADFNTDQARLTEAKQNAYTYYNDDKAYAQAQATVRNSLEDMALQQGWSKEQLQVQMTAHLTDMALKRQDAAKQALMGMDPNPRLAALTGGQAEAGGFSFETVHNAEGNGVNPDSGAKGPVQISKQDADEFAPGKDVSDPGVARQVFNVKAPLNLKALRAALGREPTDAEQYVAWQQGIGGGPALLTAPKGASALDVLTKAYNGDSARASDALVNNGGNDAMTAQDFTKHIEDYYASKNPQQNATTPVTGVASYLRPDVRQQMIQQTQGEIYTQNQRQQKAADASNAVNRALMSHQLDDAVASITDTGDAPKGTVLPTVTEMDAAGMKPGEIVNRLDQISQARLTYQMKQDTLWTTPAQDLDYKAVNQPSGAGYAEQKKAVNTLNTVLTAKANYLKGDPAEYVAKNAGLMDTLMQSINDPQKLGQVWGTMNSYYDKLGIPQSQRELLPVSVARSLSQNVLSMPAGDRAQAVVQLQQKYGSLWPQVLGSMVKRGSFPTGYEMLTATNDPVVQTALSDHLKDPQAAKTIIGPQQEAKINSAVDNSDFVKLSASLGTSTGGVQKAAEVRRAITGVAMQMVATGASLPDAVHKAVAAYTTERYDFTANNARVPVGTLAANTHYQTTIQHNLRAADLAPLANAPVGVDPKVLQQKLLQNAQSGHWITNERDDGMLLVDRQGRPIMMNSRGAPQRMEYRFDDVPVFSGAAPGPNPLSRIRG